VTKNRKKAYLALLTTSILWGLSPPVIKYTLGFISPELFLFWRFVVAVVIIAIPLAITLIKNKNQLKHFKKIIFYGFLGTPLTLYLLFLGIKRTSAIDASVISIISPIMIVLGGAFFLKEKVAKPEKIGISLALAGTLVTILQPLIISGTSFVQNLKGNLLVLGGTFAWAAFSLLVKKEAKGKIEPFILSSSSFIVGLLFFLPLAWHQNFAFHIGALPGIIFMAIFGSIIAYFASTYGISKIEVSEATVFTYLQPLFAVPLAAVWLKESISFPFLIGAGLIGLGVFIAESRQK